MTARDLLPYEQAPYDLLAHVLGSAVPAFIVTWAVGGGTAVRDLVQRCLRWRVGVGWYLLALLGPTVLTLLLAVGLTGAPVVTALAENWVEFFSVILPSLAFAFVLSNYAEEVGWTGFLFDRTQERYQPLRAAVIVAVPFAIAHIPGFIVEAGSLTDGLVLLGFLFVPQVASRVIVAWFYNNTGRSLVIVGLFHSAYNATTQSRFRENFLPVGDDIQLLLYLAVPILPAILIAILTRGRLGHGSSAAKSESTLRL
jgi:membrane protease YdiL (CAAX protease family)